MNFSLTITITFISLNFFGYFTAAFAFAPVISTSSNHNDAIPLKRSSIRWQGDTLVLGEDHIYFTLRVEVEDEDDFIEPMEEDFDNMQHPMELMLLNRACIPYVAM